MHASARQPYGLQLSPLYIRGSNARNSIQAIDLVVVLAIICWPLALVYSFGDHASAVPFATSENGACCRHRIILSMGLSSPKRSHAAELHEEAQ